MSALGREESRASDGVPSAVDRQRRRVIARRADVRDLPALEAVLDEGVAELGGLDIVVPNARIGTVAYRTHEIPQDFWQDMLDNNLTGVWHTCRAAVPYLIVRGAGSVVITNSAAGLRGYANIANYSAAKHVVVGLMRTMANELAAHNILVNRRSSDSMRHRHDPARRHVQAIRAPRAAANEGAVRRCVPGGAAAADALAGPARHQPRGPVPVVGRSAVYHWRDAPGGCRDQCEDWPLTGSRGYFSADRGSNLP